MSLRRAVIINADDFGIDARNVDEILDLKKNGLVSSISMFAAMPGSIYGITSLKKNGISDVGVHLSFSCGKPFRSRSEISSLLDCNGSFFSSKELKNKLHKLAPAELKLEFSTQIDSLASEFKVTHLDNHRPEIYFRPELFDIVIELAAERNLPLRLPFDDRFNRETAAHMANLFAVNHDYAFEIGTRYRSKCVDMRVRHTNYYFQPDLASKSITEMEAMLAGLPIGVSEICTHPGENKEEALIWRERSLRELLRAQNIDLIGYPQLQEFC